MSRDCFAIARNDASGFMCSCSTCSNPPATGNGSTGANNAHIARLLRRYLLAPKHRDANTMTRVGVFHSFHHFISPTVKYMKWNSLLHLLHKSSYYILEHWSKQKSGSH